MDKIEITNLKIKKKRIKENCDYILYGYRNKNEYPIINEINDDNTFRFIYKNFPLNIFMDNDLLLNKNLMKDLINEYPSLLYTLIKDKYAQILTYTWLSEQLISYNIFPIENFSRKLIEELFKNERYKNDFIYHFIFDSKLSIYNDFKDDKEEYALTFKERECIEIILPYIKNLINDQGLFLHLISKAESLEDLQYLSSTLDENIQMTKEMKNLLDNTIVKKRDIENDFIIGENFNNFWLKNITYDRTMNFDIYIDKIIGNIKFERPILKIKNNHILEYISSEFLEDKNFLLTTAKKGFSLSRYSIKYKDDDEVIFQEVKNGGLKLYELNESLLEDSHFIMKLRRVCPYILFYATPSLLNNYDFMLKYIKYYSTDKYFNLGEELSRNKEFFYDAVRYDSNILLYCAYEFREDPAFMSEMIFLNRNSIHFIGNHLSKNIDFINHVNTIYY